MFNGGSSSSYDHTVPKKERRLKLTIRKKDHHDDQTDFPHQNPTKLNSGSDKWLMSPKMRLIKKTITNNKQRIDHTNSNDNNHKEDHYPLDKTTFKEDHDEELKKVSTRTTTAVTTEERCNTINETGYGNNNGVIRVCSDCNTTKTPLWRSGPRGPKVNLIRFFLILFILYNINIYITLIQFVKDLIRYVIYSSLMHFFYLVMLLSVM